MMLISLEADIWRLCSWADAWADNAPYKVTPASVHTLTQTVRERVSEIMQAQLDEEAEARDDTEGRMMLTDEQTKALGLIAVALTGRGDEPARKALAYLYAAFAAPASEAEEPVMTCTCGDKWLGKDGYWYNRENDMLLCAVGDRKRGIGSYCTKPDCGYCLTDPSRNTPEREKLEAVVEAARRVQENAKPIGHRWVICQEDMEELSFSLIALSSPAPAERKMYTHQELVREVDLLKAKWKEQLDLAVARAHEEERARMAFVVEQTINGLPLDEGQRWPWLEEKFAARNALEYLRIKTVLAQSETAGGENDARPS